MRRDDDLVVETTCDRTALVELGAKAWLDAKYNDRNAPIWSFIFLLVLLYNDVVLVVFLKQ